MVVNALRLTTPPAMAKATHMAWRVTESPTPIPCQDRMEIRDFRPLLFSTHDIWSRRLRFWRRKLRATTYNSHHVGDLIVTIRRTSILRKHHTSLPARATRSIKSYRYVPKGRCCTALHASYPTATVRCLSSHQPPLPSPIPTTSDSGAGNHAPNSHSILQYSAPKPLLPPPSHHSRAHPTPLSPLTHNAHHVPHHPQNANGRFTDALPSLHGHYLLDLPIHSGFSFAVLTYTYPAALCHAVYLFHMA